MCSLDFRKKKQKKKTFSGMFLEVCRGNFLKSFMEDRSRGGPYDVIQVEYHRFTT